MKKAIILCLLLMIVISCTQQKKSDIETPSAVLVGNAKITHEQQVEYGKYLVDIMGCNDCHSPKIMTANGPVPDPDRLLSGHIAEEKLVAIADPDILKSYVLFNMNSTAAVGPWGVSFAANLTPDATGLGNWSLEHFEKAVREGKFKGLDNSRMLLPPMPWPNYGQLSNDDLAAIWAYLQSIPPVKNIVPVPVPPAG